MDVNKPGPRGIGAWWEVQGGMYKGGRLLVSFKSFSSISAISWSEQVQGRNGYKRNKVQKKLRPA